jgi:hypothetical protein
VKIIVFVLTYLTSCSKKELIMTKKVNLPTLAANAARAKASLERQQLKVRKLCDEIIARVGTGGQTIQTALGQVIVSAETETRPGSGFNITFDKDKFLELSPGLQLQLTEAGVVHTTRQVIQGQGPRVSFRLNPEAK